MTTLPAPRLHVIPCTNPACVRGAVGLEHEGRYRYAGDEETTCATCEGDGYLYSWTCCVCGLDHDCADAYPAELHDDRFTCSACVRVEALERVNFANLVYELDTLHEALEEGVDAVHLLRRVAWLSGRLDELAKAFGHKETKSDDQLRT